MLKTFYLFVQLDLTTDLTDTQNKIKYHPHPGGPEHCTSDAY